MSPPGKVCIWAMRRDYGPFYCGKPGTTTRKVAARMVIENGQPRKIPPHELTLCDEHAVLFDAGRPFTCG